MQLLSTCLSSAGIPPHVDHSQLELAVVYNTCVCFTAQSQFSEAELLLKEATERGRPLCGKIAMIQDSGTNATKPNFCKF